MGLHVSATFQKYGNMRFRPVSYHGFGTFTAIYSSLVIKQSNDCEQTCALLLYQPEREDEKGSTVTQGRHLRASWLRKKKCLKSVEGAFIAMHF